eukprot:GGOE01028712.1.p2 GENE.GGOE01028712.1~~GGOE01028712.1.p2  ORF type:complete len:120 (-),score=8.25 GGOE01028712.1:346-705(-)
MSTAPYVARSNLTCSLVVVTQSTASAPHPQQLPFERCTSLNSFTTCLSSISQLHAAREPPVMRKGEAVPPIVGHLSLNVPCEAPPSRPIIPGGWTTLVLRPTARPPMCPALGDASGPQH